MTLTSDLYLAYFHRLSHISAAADSRVLTTTMLIVYTS